jgi:hypothetical protein
MNVNKSSEDEEPYDAVRYAWRVSATKARSVDYVLAVRRGLIIGVYKVTEWLPATKENFPSFNPTGTGRVKVATVLEAVRHLRM